MGQFSEFKVSEGSQGPIRAGHQKSFIRKYNWVLQEAISIFQIKESGGVKKLKEFFEEHARHLAPHLQNVKSKQRIFTTICGFLSIEPFLSYKDMKEGKTPRFQHARRFSENRMDYILQFLIPFSTFPNRWPVEFFMDTNNSDLIYSQFLRMDKESQDGKEVIQYFVDIGVSQRMSYLEPHRNDATVDWLMKSVKFLRLINQKATDPLLIL